MKHKSTSSPSGKTFIYCLQDPTTGEVRYVGKSNNPRARLGIHLKIKNLETPKLASWLCELSVKGKKPRLQILEELKKSDWIGRERFWIEEMQRRGARLLNLSPGAGYYPFFSEESLQRFRLAHEIAQRKSGKKPKLENPLNYRVRAGIVRSLETLTLRRFAKLYGVTVKSIKDILFGRGEPDLKFLQRLFPFGLWEPLLWWPSGVTREEVDREIRKRSKEHRELP